jgi:6-pyruvoyltetrahydropterin/6-carboxytetrahydropterin synthase|tara:strand:+ start:618 stop:1316 length:699 start_codon:yes stop_codon:yes gene_type:complete
MIYTSSKVIELGSTAFRQPNAESHCKFVHGYQLKAELTFGCNELDKNNWVYDFGGLKDLKTTFNNQFDHTLVVASNDPLLDIFKALNEAGGADLRIMDGGVGIEKFAEWCFKTADTYIEEVTEGRVWVENITVFEHSNNSASVSKMPKSETVYINEEGKQTYVSHEEFEKTWKEWSEKGKIPPVKDTNEEAETENTATEETPAPNPRAAKVGPNKTTGNFSDPFAGTSWGNS